MAERNVGLKILKGLRQLARGEHGRIINVPSVASIRDKTGLSQSRVAELLGVSVRTLQEWEQERRAIGRGEDAALDRGEEPSGLAGRGVGENASVNRTPRQSRERGRLPASSTGPGSRHIGSVAIQLLLDTA